VTKATPEEVEDFFVKLRDKQEAPGAV